MTKLERQRLEAAPGGEASNFQAPTRFPVLGKNGELVGYTFAGEEKPSECACANCVGMKNGAASSPTAGCACTACAKASDTPALLETVPATLSAAQLELLGPAVDEELPLSLRGKGLVRGKPLATFGLGRNETRDGRVFIVDNRAVTSLLTHGNGMPQAAPLTYLHEHGDARTAGYAGPSCQSGPAVSVIAGDNGRDYIAWNRPYWTGVAAQGIATGERGFVSPDVLVEPLHPNTLETLTPSSPLFVGNGEGMWGTDYDTNTFRPMKWRVPASLVPVPALLDLPPASLTAARATSIHQSRKESIMDPKLLKLLGLSETATEEQKTQALSTFRAKQKTLGAARATLAAGSFDKPGIIGLIRQAWKFPAPEVLSDDQLWDIIEATADPADEANEPGETPAETPAPKAMDVPKSHPFPPAPAAAAAASVDPAVMEAALSARLPEIEKRLAKGAFDQTQKLAASDKKTKEIDGLLSDAEKAGKLVPARREAFRMRLADERKEVVEDARQELAALRAGPKVPRGQITSGGYDQSLSVDDLPREQAEEMLSRAVGFSMHEGIDFDQALESVRGGHPDEEIFHRAVLASNPDWGTGKRSDKRGAKWVPVMRKSRMQLLPQFDREKVEYIAARLGDGAIPRELISAKFQETMLSRMKLAGEVSSFQPASRFQVPGFALGIYQGEYGGNEIAPQVAGGANEEASYPIYSTEPLQAHVNAAGVPEPVGRNANDIDESYWGVDWKKVTLHGYANRVRVDRRDQAAGDSVLPMGVMASATKQAMTIEANKREIVQAAMIRLLSNYDSSCQYVAAGTRQWNDPASTPIQDWEGMATQLWRNTGKFPDISLWPVDAIRTIRFHKALLVAAQFAGMGNATAPNAMLPLEMLVSIFGPMIIPTCRISTQPGGVNADSPWGQDVIAAVVSKGEVVAPRAFATVVSAGYPVVKTAPKELDALIGSDVVKVSDMYAAEVVGPASTPTKAAFIFQSIVPRLTVVA